MIYHPSFSEVLASASEDCTIKIFDQNSRRIVASIEEHFKRVNGIEWIGDALLVSCSADKSVRVWMRDDDNWDMKCGLTLKDHQEEVVTVTCAQNGRIVLSASRDATLGCIDLEQGRCLERLEAPVVDSAYTCALFHPDGRIAGCGTETGDLHLWDIVQQKIVKSFAEEDAIRKLTFHENGHHMASTTAETIQLWDLRTMASFKCDTIDPYHRALLIHPSTSRTLKPYDAADLHCVQYDGSGRYLAAGGSDVRLYDVEHDYAPVTQFTEFPGAVRCVAFSACALKMAAGSVDHNVRIFGQEA